MAEQRVNAGRVHRDYVIETLPEPYAGGCSTNETLYTNLVAITSTKKHDAHCAISLPKVTRASYYPYTYTPINQYHKPNTNITQEIHYHPI